MNKKKFLVQGMTLAIIGIIMKSANVFYRSYLTQEIGAEGIGLYQLIFSIFVLAVTLSTSGISLAVTRLVSSCIAKGERSHIRSVVNKCLGFCLALSFFISAIFIFCSDFLAIELLGNAEASDCLKILGVGLPFMSLCTCMKGYFLAVDEGVCYSLADLVEQGITIGGTVLIFVVFPYESIETACVFAMIASTLGEMSSFVIDMICMKKSLAKHTPNKKGKSTGVLQGLSHIALPCTFSSAARSLLTSCENLLIPVQLQKFGLSYSLAMTEYGLMQGMAIPILYFPSAFIAPFAVLLIPKICKAKELGHKNAVAYITQKAVSVTFAFALITAGAFYQFGNILAEVFYSSEAAGDYIAILAPLIPLMYTDIVVDCLLKGLDEQLHSMKYNIIDSALRVILILIFMRIFGIQSYIAIIFFSTIFNASLSISKLVKVTNSKFTFIAKMLYQIPTMIFSVYIGNYFSEIDNKITSLCLCFFTSYAIYAVICLIIEKTLSYFKKS